METFAIQRSSDYFDKRALITSTGQPESSWGSVILKELIDNSLDSLCGEGSIIIHCENQVLIVKDTGIALSVEDLDNIYNFNVYLSSKKMYRGIMRGAQGNALKSIIGICYLSGYTLKFLIKGVEYCYKLNQLKYNAGLTEFEKTATPILAGEDKAVIVEGIDLSDETIKKYLWKYNLCNPDVAFSYNNKEVK